MTHSTSIIIAIFIAPPLLFRCSPRIAPLTASKIIVHQTSTPQQKVPNPSTTTQTMAPKDFDLALSTLWFTTDPPLFPIPSIRAAGPTTHTYAWEHEQSYLGILKTLILAVRFTNTMSTTKIRLTWQHSSPLTTVTASQKHIPPPPSPSAADLLHASKTYGEPLAMWAEASLHTRIGDGECWTFTHAALRDIAHTFRAVGQPPPLLSQGRTHGVCILALTAPGDNAGLLQLADVRRGDIVELVGAHFCIREAVGEKVKPVFRKGEMVSEVMRGGGERNVRMGKHTAVVVGVEGEGVSVVEQNGRVQGGVGRERYGLETMVEGKMSFWRVMGEGWMKPLEAVWED